VRVQARVRGEKEEARKADEDFFLFLEKKKGEEKSVKVALKTRKRERGEFALPSRQTFF
jgi:hypothetical protein